ncbi:MAG TPA: alanine--glyoxylate aminotransferase family protein [Vicinamibacterales bacterium]|nr:alanine--glyoxylate aminotransferase family protein [Vicinamibacterales bacterium]
MDVPDRLLLGPGPSPVSTRVLRALSAPILSHLDPVTLALLDETRASLDRLFRAPAGSFSLLISGTGTAAMETCVANLAAPGKRAVAVVNGYFGDRIAQMLERYGAEVERVEGEWGRAIDPAVVRAALRRSKVDLVTVVHAETSTGVRNPVREVTSLAREHDAVAIVDTVTSLGAVPVEVSAWQIDACYGCGQKGIGAPSGMAPVTFGPRALERRVEARSFYLDLQLLEDYWLRRKYHHTLCSSILVAFHEALAAVEEEGLEARWARHERCHHALVAGLSAIGLSLLPPEGERLPNLNAVRVPSGVDEAAVRKHLLEEASIEIGAGLGPLAGRIWRVGIMGSGADPRIVLQFLAALERALSASGYKLGRGEAVGAASLALA